VSILLTKGSKEIKAIYKSIEGERLVLERYRAFVERTKRAYSRDAKKKLKNGLNFGSGNMPPN
jgi:hypothetical protein